MQKEYDKNNIFAKILRGEVPCKKIYEDGKILAFNDINPKAPVHVLVIPRGEFICFDDFVAKASDKEISNFFRTVGKIAQEQGVSESYKVVANSGEKAGQIIPHFHIHILGYK
jgi:histidine triad (HIT) family protein